MKNVLKTLVAAAVTALMLTYNANARSVVDLTRNNKPNSTLFTGEQKDKNNAGDIHPRAVKDFQKSFKGITDEQWSRLGDGYVASFTVDSVRTRVGYNLNGN